MGVLLVCFTWLISLFSALFSFSDAAEELRVVREGPLCGPFYLSSGLRNSSGSLAIFAAIRRASSLLSNLAAKQRPAVALLDCT